ncbi:type II toxin-antitoxin system RelE/ParE family toxin [Myxococcota bacterium]|nr:type II toxin-antitoxin system RelE/ParE family toxin [Myxococcota bacterium]
MSRPRLLPAAEQELREAIDWYEDQRAGLGIEFLAAVDVALTGVGEMPDRYPTWPGNPLYRRLLLARFPFVVFFRLVAGECQVVAVAHCSRRPGYWAERLVLLHPIGAAPEEE